MAFNKGAEFFEYFFDGVECVDCVRDVAGFVVFEQWFGFVVVVFEACFDCRRLVVFAVDEFCAAQIANAVFLGWFFAAIGCAAFGTFSSGGESFDDFLVGKGKFDDEVDGCELVEFFCLEKGAWESIEEVAGREVFFDEFENKRVGCKFSLVCKSFDFKGSWVFFFNELSKELSG